MLFILKRTCRSLKIQKEEKLGKLLTAHSFTSSTHCVSEDTTCRNWSQSSDEMYTFKLALIQVTMRV